jgi:PleD family two-component response regulator
VRIAFKPVISFFLALLVRWKVGLLVMHARWLISGESNGRSGGEYMSYAEKKALVVDDSSVMRQIIKKNLKELGFGDIQDAEDGAAGLKKLGDYTVDLVVSDWNMPKMTGIEFLKKIRKDDNLQGRRFSWSPPRRTNPRSLKR